MRIDLFLIYSKQPFHIFFVYNSLVDESLAVSFHGDHTRVGRCFNGRVDLLEVTFFDIISDCCVVDHKFIDSHTILAICSLHEILTLYSQECVSQPISDNLLYLRLEESDISVDRSSSTTGVECGEYDMSCLSHIDSSFCSVLVTDLSNKDDIRILSHC